jgi:chaperone required for assembly of F1-ATPase
MTIQPTFSIKSEADGYTIYRGDEALRTPRNLTVTVPTQALAEAIVRECSGQGEKMDLRKMPFTQMALTAIDISSQHRKDVVDGIMRFGDSELLCQRTTDPADLVTEQTRVWQPYLDWCQSTFNAALKTGSGIVPFEQNPEALAALHAHVETLDAFRLTGLSEACGTLGSLVLGLALIEGHADATSVFTAAELDHIWQNKKWGEDPATQARHADIKRDLEMCAKWTALLGE